MMKGVAVFNLLLVVAFAAPPSAKIDKRLKATLSSNGEASVLVSFKQGTTSVLNTIFSQKFSSRIQKLNRVASLLRKNAEGSQSGVISFLRQNEIEVRSYWITNQIYIPNANSNVLESLQKFPEISEIRSDKVIPLEKFEIHATSSGVPWGIKKIQVDKVWELDSGNRGEGIMVGVIDTGGRMTHEALAPNFVGEYGWFDPTRFTPEPNDDTGIGTHTIGTIVGKGIGVAPNAKWMACKGCESLGCRLSAVLACGQFMLCPTLTNGSNPECTRAPNVVSTTFGTSGESDFYSPVIEAWVAAGIVPIFANGNSGPICGSTRSPGDHPLAIAVGKTGEDDALYEISSKGPAYSGVIKPDLCAPGINIYSALSTSDSAYGEITGIAGPHVAGVAALLLSRNDTLSVAEVRKYLMHGNQQDGLMRPGYNCGGISEDIFPNNAYGNGRINALNSFKKLVQDEQNPITV